MVFSSVAAIHAIVMLVLHSHLMANPVEWVSIAVAGLQPSPTIPIWPMSWDEDCDAVLAIVGAGYLFTSLMMVWSKTFQDIEAKGILFMWALLMLVGLIAALYSGAFVDLWTVSQFLFCSVSQSGLPPFCIVYWLAGNTLSPALLKKKKPC
jgi:O-antigen/teichoic acid export membrane protein